MKHLLNKTVTINQFSVSNDGGDVSESGSALHTDIPARIVDLSYSDQRFIESKEEYSKVIKKAFIDSAYTGIDEGMQLVDGSKVYDIVFVKEATGFSSLHHFELFLQINEPS